MTDAARRMPMVIGHRGAPGYRPEHTAASYRLACAQGVDAVEPDLVVSSDGVLVIRHENEISATTDVADHPIFATRRTTKNVDGAQTTGWFAEDFTWAELATLRCRERLPQLRAANVDYDGIEPLLRLRDLFALLREQWEQQQKQIGLVIELKHVQFLREQGHDLVTLLIDELAANQPELHGAELVIECFELGALDRLRDAGAPATLVFLMQHDGAPADEVTLDGESHRDYAWYRSDAGLDMLAGRVDGISLAKRDLLHCGENGAINGITNIVQRAHERGLLVFTWTMRPENQFLAPTFRESDQAAAWGRWRDEWRLILSTGLDGVFLDHPDLLTQALTPS